MVEIPGTEADESLAHIERRGGSSDPAPPVMPLAMPMIGWHDKDADAKATEKYLRRKHETSPIGLEPPELLEEKLKPADPYENVRVLIQAKPKLVMQECPLDPDMECEGRHEGLGVSGQPSDLSEEPIPYTLTDIFVTKDSGQREDFPTGSRRDTRQGKGRYDLLPSNAMRRLAQVYERGAAKYGDRNWEKGQPLSRFLDSALRHTFQVLEGKTDEDHAGQAAWNLLAFIEIQHRINEGVLPNELNDL